MPTYNWTDSLAEIGLGWVPLGLASLCLVLLGVTVAVSVLQSDRKQEALFTAILGTGLLAWTPAHHIWRYSQPLPDRWSAALHSELAHCARQLNLAATDSPNFFDLMRCEQVGVRSAPANSGSDNQSESRRGG